MSLYAYAGDREAELNWRHRDVGLIPHGQRYFSLGRLWRETLNGRPWAAFSNVSQRDIMQQIRARLSRMRPFL